LLPGYTYHLTQRCIDKEFYLHFAKDRNAYREWLRIGAKRHKVPIYGYCLTSNHVHIIAHVDDIEPVGMLMDLVAGSTARNYNRRKKRSGSMWEPYQCTIVQDGNHLFNCLRYVDLNMVRAGKVSHPGEWRWCGWDELTGVRERYRIIAMDRLLQSLDMSDVHHFRTVYRDAVERHLENRDLSREEHWTESLAVGSRFFVEETASRYTARYDFSYAEATHTGDCWSVREDSSSYNAVQGPEH